MEWSTVYDIFVTVYELADTGLDVATFKLYEKEDLTPDAEYSVSDTLVAFAVLGAVFAVLRICLFAVKYCGLFKEETVEEYFDRVQLLLISLDAIFEHFPQSAIAAFGLEGCPKGGSGVVERLFGLCCALPSLDFIRCLVQYCRKHNVSSPMCCLFFSVVVVFVVDVAFVIVAFVSDKECY